LDRTGIRAEQGRSLFRNLLEDRRRVELGREMAPGSSQLLRERPGRPLALVQLAALKARSGRASEPPPELEDMVVWAVAEANRESVIAVAVSSLISVLLVLSIR